jgi:ABC-type uncharacterized transport system substrate-binding protein
MPDRWCLRVLLLAISLFAFAAPACAMDVAFALSHASGPHRQFFEAVQLARAPLPHQLSDGGNVDEGLDAGVLERADVIVAVGARATEEVLRKFRGPILSVLVSRAQYRSLGAAFPHAQLSAMVLDHPAIRHMRLASAVAPNVRRVGLLIGPESTELEKGFETAAADSGVTLLSRRIRSVEDLLPQLEQLLQASDALLMIPDPIVASQSSARTILLTSYRYRKPIIAYSQAYVQAGALAAVYSSPEDVAMDFGDWLRSAGPESLRQPLVLNPVRFSVAVNRQVARSLGLDVPSDSVLMERIAGTRR